MKKIIFLTLTIFSITFLSWCSIDWNWEKDKKISEQYNQILRLENQIEEFKKVKNTKIIEVEKQLKENENDLFKKKQECIKDENKALWFLQKWDEINSIFYSKKLNSCLISFIRYETVKNDDLERVYPVHIIRDIYTMEWLFHETDAPKWEDTIQELKWE